MPGYTLPLTESRIIADLMRRQHGMSTSMVDSGGLSLAVDEQEWTVAATPATTYTLRSIPLDKAVWVELNGLGLREGTDYTLDYTTGIITVVTSAQALTSGDVLWARWITNNSTAAAVQAATVYTACQTLTDHFNRADAGDGTLGTADTGQRWANAPVTDGGWTTQGAVANTAQATITDVTKAVRALIDVQGNNQDVTVSVNLPTGSLPYAALMVRTRSDMLSGYYVSLVPGGTSEVVKFMDGAGSGTSLATFSSPAAGTHTLRVVVKNALLNVWLDATQVVTNLSIPADDAGGHQETLWNFVGLMQQSTGIGVSIWHDDLSVVAPA